MYPNGYYDDYIKYYIWTSSMSKIFKRTYTAGQYQAQTGDAEQIIISLSPSFFIIKMVILNDSSFSVSFVYVCVLN